MVQQNQQAREMNFVEQMLEQAKAAQLEILNAVLKAGVPICYDKNGKWVQENPDGTIIEKKLQNESDKTA